jgi:hypothetical protein
VNQLCHKLGRQISDLLRREQHKIGLNNARRPFRRIGGAIVLASATVIHSTDSVSNYRLAFPQRSLLKVVAQKRYAA